MSKMFKTLVVCLLTVFIGFSSVIPAKAENQVKMTEQDIRKIDNFIKVKHNQFVLDIPNNIKVDKKTIKFIQNHITEVNESILINHQKIDVITKKIIIKDHRITRSWEHQLDYFWWGTRHIFRTDSAVNEYAHAIHNLVSSNAGINLFASLLGIPVVPAITGISMVYFSKIANDLKYEKSKYNKIELDVTWVAVYRIIEWRD